MQRSLSATSMKSEAPTASPSPTSSPVHKRSKSVLAQPLFAKRMEDRVPSAHEQSFSRRFFCPNLESEDAEPMPDVSRWDIEIFDRRMRRIVTSLRRLEARIHYELDTNSVGHKNAISTLSATEEEQTYVWVLVRRVTRRLAKLELLSDVLLEKKRCLIEEQHEAVKDHARERLRVDASLVDGLRQTIDLTVRHFENLESHTMRVMNRF